MLTDRAYFAVDEFEDIFLIHCMHCNRYLGWLKDKKYYLLSTEIIKKVRRVNLIGLGLNDKDTSAVMNEVSLAGSSLLIDVYSEIMHLRKAELQKFKIEDVPKDTQGIVLVHKNSGRLLLSDENGLYQKVFEEVLHKKSSLM